MVSTSKILTVSYGTFSCTLEGFDDSFDTMKAIAEYFRDLAAEDRYFGAEPPVPDAEMLARIAEREIARRVEAREERGSIVLRAAPYGAVAAPLTPFVAPQTPPTAAPFAQPAAARHVPEQAPAQQAPAPEVAAQVVPEPPVQVAATEAPPYAEAATPEPVETFAKAPKAEADTVDEWEDVTEEVAPTVAPAQMTTAPLRPTPVPHPDPDSVAAKLQRIRDVVTKSAAVAETASYSEDEHADSFLSETAQSIESALDIDDGVDGADAVEEEGDDIAALLSRLAQDAPTGSDAVSEDDLYEDDMSEEEATDAVMTDDADADLGDTSEDVAPYEEIAEEPAQDDAAHNEMARDEAAELAEDDDLTAAYPEEETLEETLDEAQADKSDLDQPEAVAEAGRVLMVKRDAFEAAIARGDLVAEDETETQDTAAQDDDAEAEATHTEMPKLTPHADLSPEDEDALRRELAAVEAELVEIYRDTDDHADPRADLLEDEDEDEALTSLFDEDDEDGDDEDGDDADHADDDDAPLVLRDPRDRLVQSTAEDDMSRLMAMTETALTEPENASRRNAIAHLRAAVAATKAEQSSGSISARSPAANPFRDDLADVVRPRRPVGDAGAPTPRPSEARPAPLKLVAEQRVDLPEGRGTAPVRPRRVSLAPLPDEAEDMPARAAAPAVAEDGFAAFASKMGATALPDLLEAAAAYLIHVEGREEFSRPQLMTKARQASDGALNREDGLRSFGQLLRQGKIQKLRGGRFTASDDIGFKPDARRVG